MKYFNYISSIDERLEERLFYKKPVNIDKNTDFNTLKYSLGAFLYIPAIQEKMLDSVLNKKIKDLSTFAICLEDSVGDSGEEEAIENLEMFLEKLSNQLKNNQMVKEDLPLIFIRPKNEDCLIKISPIVKKYENLLMGIVIPKATAERVDAFVNILDDNMLSNMYILPIIESPEFIQAQLKNEAFTKMAFVINKYHNRILNIRIGVTDILGYYGIRREKTLSIYDSVIYKMFVSDIIGYLQDLDIPISGGVSEFFNISNCEILESFEKEMLLDRLNGLSGKTVIHPKQLTLVQLFNVVSYEDYMDAKAILSNTDNKFGALGSLSSDRMNEIKPHYKWAKKILTLASIYGVYNEAVSFRRALIELRECK